MALVSKVTPILEPLSPALEERFWSKVRWSECIDDCWEWQGYRSNIGYGHYRLRSVNYKAHRIAWAVSHNVHPTNIPVGKVVRHTCDNRCCCNPHHLELGSQYDNVRDMVDRGRLRVPSGGDSHFAKLTESQVIEILTIYNKGSVSQRKLSLMYNVNEETIGQIIRGYSWKNIDRSMIPVPV